MRPGALAIAVAVIIAGVAGGLGARQLSRVGVHEGYAPEQPIAFSHKQHAGDSQIPCLYCHFGARTSRHAGIPPVNVCMNCHSVLTKQTVEIEKLKETVQRGQAIAWTKVHNLPDFVLLQPQSARHGRRRVRRLSRSGRDDGPRPPAGHAHDGLVPGLPQVPEP